MKKLLLIAYVLVLFTTFSCETLAKEEADIPLYARSALLLDASNNRVLYEENGTKVMPMASTTKIMTCMLAIESGKLQDMVTVSGYASGMPKVRMGMRKGESYRLEDLLYSLMLESHNDTAVAIAEHLGGTVEEFAAKMNEKAKSLGCKNTYFITPNGLDASEKGKQHSTTARDLAVIAAYAIKNEEFVKIVNTKNYSFSDSKGKRNIQLNNTDRFLDLMDGAIGIKTGFTNGAGYCFVGALTKEGKTFISVVLASGWPPNKNWKWTDTTKLMEFGLSSYEEKNIFEADFYKDIVVQNGVDTSVQVETQKEDITLLLSDFDMVEKKVVMKKTVNAPVLKGTQIGEEQYYVNGNMYKKLPILTKNSVIEFNIQYCVKQIMTKFLLYKV